MKTRQSLLVALLSCVLCSPVSLGYAQENPQDSPKQHTSARSEYRSPQLEGDRRIIHALNRFTFGPRPGDLQTIHEEGLDKWFDQQLHPESIDETGLNARLAQFPAIGWTTAQLLYYLPSNGVIRQSINGRVAIPSDPVMHAIYENQIARVEAKKKSKADKAQQVPQQTTPAMNDGSPAMNPRNEAAGSSNSMAAPANDMSASAVPAQPQFTPAALQNILELPPQQRMNRLIGMDPEMFEGFIKSLKPVQRQALVADLSPGQKLTVGALENPERVVAEELIASRLTRDIYSNAQLQEVITDFWLNHFNVYLRKDAQMPYYLVSYERDTVRPHALGRFEDLLEAVAHSPAMLVYLDNAESIGPDSLAAQRAEHARARNRDPQKKKVREGLNENYARELMELHTVGVNGGYTQADVIQAARVLTGWTVDRPL